MGRHATDAVARFWSKVEKTDSCWLWKAKIDRLHGYGHFWLHDHTCRAHRIAWEFANGRAIPNGLDVLHSCDNPACVNPAHLFLGTQHDNMRDCVAKGRMRKGGDSWNAKLTEADVREIRRLHADGVTQKHLSERFGVASATICHIIERRTWRHVS